MAQYPKNWEAALEELETLIVSVHGKEIDAVGIVETVGEIIVNNPRNPCGKGNYISCQCKNGERARFAPGDHCDSGEIPVSCECPNGESIKDINQLIHSVDAQFHRGQCKDIDE